MALSPRPRISMYLLAITPLPRHVLCVVRKTPEKKVVGPNTKRVVAVVQDAPTRYLANRQEPRNTVGELVAALPPEAAILW